jgi:transcriptional regulator with XRE-family HTH domain
MTANALSPAAREDVVVTRAVLRAATALGLSQRELAAVLGLSEASVSRLSRGRPLSASRKEGELALLLIRVFRSLDALVGGDERKARAWFQAENAHLGGVPAERVRRVEGLVEVATYLDAMRGHL